MVHSATARELALEPGALSLIASPIDGTEPTAAVAPRAGGGTVEFEGVGKIYQSSSGPVHALQDITTAVPAGSIFGMIGRSGAGKSSLLRTINRLERPSAGRVLVDGEDIDRLDEAGLVTLRRRIGMIFQHFNLLSAKTVRENVGLPLLVAKVPEATIRRRVDEVLRLVRLEAKQDVYPGRLSGGQKQRVGIARALVHNPQILLSDEATSALDPETTQSILALLRDINQRFGLTIILITHEMSVIREICDRVLVLEGGKAVEEGPVWRVFGNPRHVATRALLQPLQHGLPADLAAALRPQPPAHGAVEQIVQIDFTGEGQAEPDLAAITRAVGGRVRLLQGGVDRIQGHTHGRLLVAVPGAAPLNLVAAATDPHVGAVTGSGAGSGAGSTTGTLPPAHHAQVLGYVAAPA